MLSIGEQKMSQEILKPQISNFSRGLVTDQEPFNPVPNSVLDMLNCDILDSGEITRRNALTPVRESFANTLYSESDSGLGVNKDFETKNPKIIFTSPSTTVSNIIHPFRYQGVREDGRLELYGLQINSRIYFYTKMENMGLSFFRWEDALSSGAEELSYIDLDAYKVFDDDKDYPVQTCVIRGILAITSPSLPVLLWRPNLINFSDDVFNEDTISNSKRGGSGGPTTVGTNPYTNDSQAKILIDLVRDFDYQSDSANLSVTDEQKIYDRFNVGWSEEAFQDYRTGAGVGTFPTLDYRWYTVKEADGTFDYAKWTKLTRLQSKVSGGKFVVPVFENVGLYSGATTFKDVSAVPDFADITTDGLPLCKGLSFGWDDEVQSSGSYTGVDLSPKVASTLDSSGFSAIESYAGRLWKAGSNHPNRLEKIYFSQLFDDTDVKIGTTGPYCPWLDSDNRYSIATTKGGTNFSHYHEGKLGYNFSVNDPTSEILNDPLDTDGGTITIEGLGGCLRLKSLGPDLIVFGTNGIWSVRGTNGRFSPVSYFVEKISSISLGATFSLVEAEGNLFFWGNDSIYILRQADNSLGGLPTLIVENISNNRINNYIKSIVRKKPGTGLTSIVKETLSSCYSSFEKRIYWYFSTGENTSYANNRNNILVFDLDKNLFLKWKIQHVTNTSVLGIYPYESSVLHFDSGNVTFKPPLNEGLRFLCFNTNHHSQLDPVTYDLYDVPTWYEMSYKAPRDWMIGSNFTNNDTNNPVIEAWFETPHLILGDLHNNKTAPYLNTIYRTDRITLSNMFVNYGGMSSYAFWGRKYAGDNYSNLVYTNWDGNNSSDYHTLTCLSRTITFDEDTGESSDFGTGVNNSEFTTLNYGKDFEVSQNRLRGRGRLLQLRYENNGEDNFLISGFEIITSRNREFG